MREGGKSKVSLPLSKRDLERGGAGVPFQASGFRYGLSDSIRFQATPVERNAIFIRIFCELASGESS